MTNFDELEIETPNKCPNCGNPMGNESTCPHCGVIVFQDGDELDVFDEDNILD